MTSHAVAPSHNPQRLVLLGSTGSVGTQTPKVLSRLGKHASQVAAPAIGEPRLEPLIRQAVTQEVPVLAVTGGGEDLTGRLRQALRSVATQAGRPDRITAILTGPDAVTTAVQAAGLRVGDTVINGITGLMGLLSILATLASGARLALANKESLVVRGALVRQALARPGQIVSIGSGHSAIAQALVCSCREKGLTSPVLSGHNEVWQLVLAASGGPFRERNRAELTGISAAAAFKHPTQDTGPVATISSSTLVGKGFELVEAHLLSDVAPEWIDVVVHPQSVVRSMVEFINDVTIAQASPPDMRLPITLDLAWSERPDLSGLVTPNDWCEPVSWTFELLDDTAFPAADLARSAVAASDTHPAVLNAANEQAIAVFLAGGLGWLDIVGIDVTVVDEHEGLTDPGLNDVLVVEAWTRARADEPITARNG